MRIQNGLSYFNIHTTINGGGEIRGQLAPAPLPAALPLFATGLGVLGLLGWRRKRKAVSPADQFWRGGLYVCPRRRQVSSEKPLAHSPPTAFGSVMPMDPLPIVLFGVLCFS